MKTLIVNTALAFALALSPLAIADKNLNNELSSVSFVSIKKGSAAEAHTFKTMTGTLSDKGELNLTIDLGSVDTKIPIRDERMKMELFETAKYPQLTLSATVDGNIAEGEIKPLEAEATLELHGVKQPIKVKALVTNNAGKIMAFSQSPVIISAATFGLEAGVKKLQEIAQLPSIATAVPVNFVLVFE